MSSEFRTSYLCNYCPDINLDVIQSLVKTGASDSVRLCYAASSHSRIYLWYRDGELLLVPYTKRNNMWHELPKYLWDMKPLPEDLLTSDARLFEFMQYAMARQFRQTHASFHEELPSWQAIVSALNDGDTAVRLRELRYAFYETLVEKDPEWQGGLEVICADGVLVIPYTSCVAFPEQDEDKYLLVKYATFVPDSKIAHLLKRIASLFDAVGRAFANIHFSDLNYKVERSFSNGTESTQD